MTGFTGGTGVVPDAGLIDGLLPPGTTADGLRAGGPEAMRRCLCEVAERGADRWTGPLPVLVSTLAALARVDLCLARLVEGHADALRILAQAGCDPRPGVYGVWASRSAGTGVTAVPAVGGWAVSGELRFASGVDLVDRALLPAWPAEGAHLLLDVDAAAVDADRGSWATAAMDASRSFTVAVDLAVPDADRVGPPGFYLDRDGFVVGGLVVAGVWYGGARQVLDLVADGLRAFQPTAHQLRRVGRMAQAVWQAGAALDAALAGTDAVPAATGDDPAAGRQALTAVTAAARTAVADACETVVAEAAHVVGPGGLSRGGRLPRTLADLGLYVRQHHTDLELARAGQRALDSAEVLG